MYVLQNLFTLHYGCIVEHIRTEIERERGRHVYACMHACMHRYVHTHAYVHACIIYIYMSVSVSTLLLKLIFCKVPVEV